MSENPFTTISGVPIEPLYGPEHVRDLDPVRDVAEPGHFPYTRGIHESMYRGKLWTMRQFSGFATPEETNRRYHYLLEQGQTGLSVAFDLPTLMGYDADHPLSEGEVGKCGVAISSLEDMETLFRGIPLGDVTVSMTINSPAAVLWAMYLAVAEKQGVDWARLSGTIQNDILKEYIAQKEYLSAPAFHAAGHRHDRIFDASDAPLQPNFDQRLPHPRGRLDGGPGTRFYAARRHRIRSVGTRTRSGHRFLCPPAQLLFQRAQRFLRGDRKVSGRAQDLGLRHA
jgi:hypothetical protein